MTVFLVTGGAGFIGSNLVTALLTQGHEVRVLDTFATGKRSNLAGIENHIVLIDGDLRNIEAVRQAVKGVDYVLHQAALPSVPRSVRDPLASNEVNAVGTLNVLLSARDEGVKRLVYASSSSIYGDSPTLPKNESMCPNPLSPYAISKLSGEQYCQIFWRLYGFETVSLRYFNVFGPRQDPSSEYAAVIPRFIRALLRKEPLTVNGDGSQSRDFTYIDNVVSANLFAVIAPDAAGHVLNIACGERHTLIDLIDHLSAILNYEPKITYCASRPADVLHSLADVSKARDLIGYEPVVDFRTGLERTVAWFERYPEFLS